MLGSKPRRSSQEASPCFHNSMNVVSNDDVFLGDQEVKISCPSSQDSSTDNFISGDTTLPKEVSFQKEKKILEHPSHGQQ